ncbi:hypothetical protein ACN42_g3642 [Penicillium freii]|uniref:Uncharacterized protein n=1 Tax=Penicillium freii TaxID=48697 RepID=A0A101MMV9_PENFR|nr:hypothetical protein ACN42_g3642 [Penicillium freii]
MLYPRRLSKKKRKGRTVSKAHHSTASYRVSAEETRLAYSAPPRHSKCGGQRDLFFFPKEVSLITLTDAFIGPSILFSFFQNRQTRDLPAVPPRMIGYQRCLYPVWR